MATFNFVNDFSQQLAKGTHIFGTHTFNAVLTNTAPIATNTQYSNLTDLTTAGGYTAGGYTIGTITVGVGGAAQTAKISVSADPVLTASGAIGPFRYVAIINNTATNKNIVGWLDYGSAITMAAAETFTLDFDQTNGWFTVN